jgi:hypothetical protein
LVNAQGRSRLSIKKQQRGEVSDPFGTVCPLPAVSSRGLLRFADQDISVSVAASTLRSFNSLSCDNVSVVQLTGMSGNIGA